MKIFLEKTVPSEPISRDKKDNSKPMNGVREFIRSHIISSVASRSIRIQKAITRKTCDGVAALSLPVVDVK